MFGICYTSARKRFYIKLVKNVLNLLYPEPNLRYRIWDRNHRCKKNAGKSFSFFERVYSDLEPDNIRLFRFKVDQSATWEIMAEISRDFFRMPIVHNQKILDDEWKFWN